MKNKITAVTMSLIVLELICLFIPFCFNKEFWKYVKSIVYHGHSVHEYDTGVNILGVYHGFVRVLAIILIVSMLISFVAYLLQMLKKENKLSAMATWIPIFTIILLGVFTIIACSVKDDYYNFYWVWSINWMYYIIIVLHIVVIIFSLILKFKKFDDVLVSKTNNYSELEELKALLDKGILTQEEFDAKKKQVLGL